MPKAGAGPYDGAGNDVEFNRPAAVTVDDFSHYITLDTYLYTGWPNKNRTFLRYHIFAATTDIA